MAPLRQWQQFKKILRYALYQVKSVAARLLDPFESARLRRRRARGELTHVRCLVPFTRLEFLGRGLVTSCCQAFTHVQSVGNMKRGSIEGIWNGPLLQRLRRRMLLGELDKICRPNCPLLNQPPLALAELPEASEHARRLKADLLAGRTRLTAWPNYFTLSNWGACNLSCIMCGNHTQGPMPAHVARTHANLQHYLDKEVTLVLTGNGDPLARRDTRELLTHFSRERHPGVTFEILTNGLLWTEATWAKIRHCQFNFINISVDAASKATYEKIRRGGLWEALLRSFELLRQAKAAGEVRGVNLNMTVMRSNYREIPQFVRLARSYGFGAYFTLIRGAFGDENIFEMNDEAALAELRQVLADPSLQGPDMDFAPLAEFLPRT